ncbi:hypothetical protein [Zymomonas sp.]|uniref:hypothetical protein n=1 Tax=Zymomonas sp. TaxID=2068624 RepID=UPI0025DB7185|nr:hypothetical protein [Zymomonas sp.]MCA1956516.1 hypothetical protein [Zymomonas sp.]
MSHKSEKIAATISGRQIFPLLAFSSYASRTGYQASWQEKGYRIDRFEKGYHCIPRAFLMIIFIK